MECITCDYPLVDLRCTNPDCEQYSIKEYVKTLKDKLHHRNMQIKALKDKIVGYKYVIEHCNQGCREASKDI